MNAEARNAADRWWSLSVDEQDAENERRKAAGQKPIPTHRHRPQVRVSPPILLSLGGEAGIKPVGECLGCGHIHTLVSFKDAPYGAVTHGLCRACLDACLPLRGDCSDEGRGCSCEMMGEKVAERNRALADEEKAARLALAREVSRG